MLLVLTEKRFFWILISLLLFFAIVTAISFAGNKNQKLNIGNVSLDIALKNPEGEIRKLSSLRGNYVLVDFWASWCSPCREKNRELVDVYKDLRRNPINTNKPFSVYKVALENERNEWISAIDSDDISFFDNVVDLNSWNSDIAKDYNIKVLPSNYLLNPEGIIIAKNIDLKDIESVISHHDAKKLTNSK